MPMELSHFHTMTPAAVFEALSTGPQGLSETEVQERLALYGPNELVAGKKITAWRILLRQFTNLLITILLVATVISFFLGERLDAWVILAIVLACVVLGFVQEYRAEQAAAALQKLAPPLATVLRGGKEQCYRFVGKLNFCGNNVSIGVTLSSKPIVCNYTSTFHILS